jgi:hypothetical protein
VLGVRASEGWPWTAEFITPGGAPDADAGWNGDVPADRGRGSSAAVDWIASEIFLRLPRDEGARCAAGWTRKVGGPGESLF